MLLVTAALERRVDEIFIADGVVHAVSSGTTVVNRLFTDSHRDTQTHITINHVSTDSLYPVYTIQPVVRPVVQPV